MPCHSLMLVSLCCFILTASASGSVLRTSQLPMLTPRILSIEYLLPPCKMTAATSAAAAFLNRYQAFFFTVPGSAAITLTRQAATLTPMKVNTISL